jgi:ketosteroid isomerase-like protein
MLRREQWERIWPVTRGFQFDEEGRQVQVSGNLAWVASTWSSEGLDETGGTFLRGGRVTIILERAGNGEWKAIHTHYSVYPTLPARP